jgi:hypothetical protein
MPSIFGKLLKRNTIAPNQFDAIYGQATSAAATQDFQRAIQLDDQAIERRPDYAYAYCNRGVVQQSLGLTAAALSSYDQAIALEATDAMAHYNRSLALLFHGDFENGWRGYEWRWKNAQRLCIGEPRNFAQPLWLGEDSIAGKRLLLYSEGGLGDTLQFCRYSALIAALGATVLLEVQAPLLGVLANLDGVSIRLADWVAHLPLEFQYFCLQTHVREADKAALDSSPFIVSFDDDLLDFVNTAALCECMDVVISVDTSLAHLSGALGRRTWVLLPFNPDWRWLRDRDDSPWYPTAKLYRQKAVGDWNEVFARVATDLHWELGSA